MSTVLTAVGEATGLKPTDEVIAHGLLAGAKMKVLALTAALAEATTTEVRHLLTTQLQDAVAGHERMIKLAEKRGWYKGTATPEEQLKAALKLAQPVVQ